MKKIKEAILEEKEMDFFKEGRADSRNDFQDTLRTTENGFTGTGEKQNGEYQKADAVSFYNECGNIRSLSSESGIFLCTQGKHGSEN